jgi:two-component system, NarL family, sensor histidine kinase UhpB
MSLRLRINLLITALMCLFALVLGRMVIDDTRSSIREEIEAGTKVTIQMLSTIVLASEYSGVPRPFLLSFLQRLGRVRANQIRLLDTAGDVVIYESPPSQYKAGRNAPNWYAQLVMPGYQPSNILLRGARIEVIPDPSRATLDAWDDLTRLLILAGLFFVLVNSLVFWFVSRSMRPMEHIQKGLAEMEAGRVDVTLPAFHLPEFRRISEAFNRMTKALGDAMAENRRVQAAEIELKHNRDLAHLLEDERRGIAQELHDELGQCVTAIRSIAESIGQRAGDGMPDIRAAANSIKDIAGRIYDGMHAIVRRLRPAELDMSRLEDTIRETAALWAARNPGIDLKLNLAGDLQGLGDAVNLTVYRLVSEGLTNIARHADASQTVIDLAHDDGHQLRLSIRDNGHGNVPDAVPGGGFGLIGMRERVQALGGSFAIDGKPGNGTVVRAVIPLDQP